MRQASMRLGRETKRPLITCHMMPLDAVEVCAQTCQRASWAPQADSATVLRDGRLAVVPAAQLVPGDIVEVSVGGDVPADLRVAERLSATLR